MRATTDSVTFSADRAQTDHWSHDTNHDRTDPDHGRTYTFHVRTDANPDGTDKALLFGSVRHRMQQHVDTECVATRPEGVEVGRIVGLALPGIRDIRVVRHEDHDAAAVIGDESRVGL